MPLSTFVTPVTLSLRLCGSFPPWFGWVLAIGWMYVNNRCVCHCARSHPLCGQPGRCQSYARFWLLLTEFVSGRGKRYQLMNAHLKVHTSVDVRGLLVHRPDRVSARPRRTGNGSIKMILVRIDVYTYFSACWESDRLV